MLKILPNLLTLSRIAVIPLLICLLMFVSYPLGNWLAFAVYVYACITDFFDGYLAREMKQESIIGTFLDPIADKLLVAAVLLTLMGIDRMGGLTVIPASIILCREIIVSGLREFLAQVKVSMPVTKLSKWKTSMQMVAIGFLLVGPAGPQFGIFSTTEIGICGLWGAAALTIFTGCDYLKVGIHQILGKDDL